MKKLALFNHGKDSEPWGRKTVKLAKVAKQHGYQIESIDYRHTTDPQKRVETLLATDLSGYDEVVLIGSSMGGYVATVAAPIIQPKGLFLMAPAFYLPNYPQTEFNPPADHTFIVQGWQDVIVPPENAWRFSQLHQCRLKLLAADHNLLTVLDEVCEDFVWFLQHLC
jgi:pimeloyl-ACP methyl ester carboxylesterase